MNVSRSLIQEFILYEFELGHNTAKATQTICCVKGAVDHNTVTIYWKKFRSGCKNLDDQARLDGPKSGNFAFVLQAIEANPASIKWSRQFTVHCGSSSLWPWHLELSNCVSRCQNIAKLFIHVYITVLMKKIALLFCNKSNQVLKKF